MHQLQASSLFPSELMSQGESTVSFPPSTADTVLCVSSGADSKRRPQLWASAARRGRRENGGFFPAAVLCGSVSSVLTAGHQTSTVWNQKMPGEAARGDSGPTRGAAEPELEEQV